MNFVRWILGRLVLTYDALTRPKPVTRDAAAQAEMDSRTEKFALYQFNACPFCVKVRRELRRHGLNIELRDARNDAAHKQALIEGGGRFKVPCLQIAADTGEPTWLYESDDIIAYLKKDLQLA
ncbi:MAG: glutaredoxin family protein [Alphaproteobacteria bacterium]